MAMKISAIEHCAPILGPTKAKPAGRSQDEAARIPAVETREAGEPSGEIKNAEEPAAALPIADFQPSGVHNDFSAKYRRAELALEGTIYRLAKQQLALQDSGEDAGGVTDLPSNANLQQTADQLAMLAHIESVSFRNGD
jgi:hypothetical protein